MMLLYLDSIETSEILRTILCKMDDGNWKQKQIVTKDSKSFVALVASEDVL